jgi:hypothetical protein
MQNAGRSATTQLGATQNETPTCIGEDATTTDSKTIRGLNGPNVITNDSMP